MSLLRDVHHGLRIGRAEFRRSVRQQIHNNRRLLGLILAILFFGGSLLFMLPTAFILGRTVRTIDTLPYFAPATTVLPVGLLLLAILRTLERIGSSDTEDLLLTTVHPRAVVIGLVTAEVARMVAWFGVPLGALLVAFSLGLGAPTLPMTVSLLMVPLVCWTAVWGYAGGLVVLRVFRRLPTVRRVLKGVGVFAMVGLIVVSQFIGPLIIEEGQLIQDILEGIALSPLTDYVALVFIGTHLARTITPGAIAVLCGLGVMIPVGLHIATLQASELWFTDVVSHGGTAKRRISTSKFTVPRPFAWRKSGRIAWGLLVRGVRNPGKFGHLVMIVFIIGPFGTTLAQSSHDALGLLVAGMGVGLGAYFSGATFGLNPLGDDRPQLPLLLLTPTNPQTILRGRMCASLAVGIPIAVSIPLGSILLGTAPMSAIVFATVGLGMCLTAALFSIGIGTVYPIYEKRKFWGTETVVPSTLVMIGYLVVVTGGTVIGLILTWYHLSNGIGSSPAIWVGSGIYLLITAGVSYGSYRYGQVRYERYTIDQQ
jgi:hypothetical protein